jgi:CheY-like chemotaxis protein
VILNYGALAIESLPHGDPIRDDVREIVKAGERARNLTRQLLAFGRQQIRQPRLLDLGVICSSLENVLQGLLGERIRLVTRIPPGGWFVVADRGQIDLLLMSLAGHARDSMPGGGTLTVALSAGVHESSARVLLSVSLGEGETVAATHDSLGLAAVRGIVEQNGGLLRTKGSGTGFEICFPREQPAPEPRAALAPQVPKPSETILLTDDDRHVRRVVSSMLRRRGYHVMEASDPMQAMRLSKEFEGKIDLLLTDVTMPQMNGRELSDNLAVERPDMKIVFMSGYTNDALLHDRVLSETAVVLQKPFETEELLSVLRRALDAET